MDELHSTNTVTLLIQAPSHYWNRCVLEPVLLSLTFSCPRGRIMSPRPCPWGSSLWRQVLLLEVVLVLDGQVLVLRGHVLGVSLRWSPWTWPWWSSPCPWGQVLALGLVGHVLGLGLEVKSLDWSLRSSPWTYPWGQVLGVKSLDLAVRVKSLLTTLPGSPVMMNSVHYSRHATL